MFRSKTKTAAPAPAKASASESTPLNDAAAQAAGKAAVDTVSEMAKNAFTADNFAQVSQLAAERVDEISQKVMTGNLSIRAMALMGGTALVFFAISGLVGEILTLRWAAAVMEAYTLVLGCVMVLLESPILKVPESYMQKLYKYCLFLKFIWGRGILYFIVGNLQFSQGGIINFCVGGFVMFVGLLYVLVGRQAAKKLSEMKHTIYSEKMLQQQFQKHDKNGDDFIDLTEFGAICDDLNLDLTKREKEGIFFHLDTSDDDLLSYEEFSQWWNNFDASQAV